MEDRLMGLGNNEDVNAFNNAASRFACKDGYAFTSFPVISPHKLRKLNSSALGLRLANHRPRRS